jgi:hypothetical protein
MLYAIIVALLVAAFLIFRRMVKFEPREETEEEYLDRQW